MVSQKERVERVEGGLSEEGTMKIGWVCACARAFARERGAPGTKPSRRGSVLCGRSERAGGEGAGRSIRGGYNGNGPGLCMHLRVHEVEGAGCTRYKTEPPRLGCLMGKTDFNSHSPEGS